MKCRHCDVEFRRPDGVLPIPHDRCSRCHEEIEALNEMGKKHGTGKPMMKTKAIIAAALMGVSGFLLVVLWSMA